MFVIRAVILAGEITVKPSLLAGYPEISRRWNAAGISDLSSGQDLFQKSVGMGDVKLADRAGMVSWRLSGYGLTLL